MELSNYIVEFLLQNKAVFIPSIGTLRVVSISASFDADTKKYASPSEQITITSGEQYSNEEFIRFLMAKESISETQATQLWQNYLLLLKERIDNDNQYTLPNLGYLKKGPNDNISFVQNENIDFLNDNFGFETLDNIETFDIGQQQPIPEIIPEKAEKETPETTEKFETVRETLPENKPENIITPEPKEQQEDTLQETTQADIPELSNSAVEKIECDQIHQNIAEGKSSKNAKDEVNQIDKATIAPVTRKRKSRPMLLWIIIILLILAILSCYFFCYKNYQIPFFCSKNDTLKVEDSLLVAKDTIPGIIDEETIVYADTAIVAEQIETVVSFYENSRTIDGILVLTKSKEGIDIISGFFKVETNALKEAHNMQEKGYNSYIIERQPFGEKQYYVSIGSFSQKEEAITFMREVAQSKKIQLVLKNWQK